MGGGGRAPRPAAPSAQGDDGADGARPAARRSPTHLHARGAQHGERVHRDRGPHAGGEDLKNHSALADHRVGFDLDEQELADGHDDASAHLSNQEVPQISAEEFESAFQWFLS